MPIGMVIHSGPRPKPRAAKAKRSPVAIEKPAIFRSSICSASPPTIQSIGPGRSASRSGKPPRQAETAVPIASRNSPAAIT